jgi:hypothetical protein
MVGLGLPLPKGGSVANLGAVAAIARASTDDAPKHVIPSAIAPSRLLASSYDAASWIIDLCSFRFANSKVAAKALATANWNQRSSSLADHAS